MKKVFYAILFLILLASKSYSQCAGNPIDGKKTISGSTREQVLSFNIKHTFSVIPSGPILPLVNAISYNHAWVNETNVNCTSGAVNPPAQPIGFLETAKDTFVNNNITNNGVQVNYKYTPVTPAGLQMTDSAFSWSCNSRSRGNTCIKVDPYVYGLPISGVIQNYGFSQALLPPQTSQADAISLGDVAIQSGKLLKSGTISWGPVMESMTGGKAHIIRQKAGTHDPIEYFIHDYTTNTNYSGTLLNIRMNFNTSNDTLTYSNFWRNDSVFIESDTLEFEIEFPSPSLTLSSGHLFVQVENGVVIASTGTGIFTGFPPLVGTLTPVYFFLPNQLQFNYNLGNFGNDSLLVKINMYGYSENNDVPASVVINVADSTVMPKCYGTKTGKIYLAVTDGFPPYSYLWSDGKTTKNRINIATGTYIVTATDKFGYSTVKTVYVPSPAALAITISKTTVTCFGGTNGTATATVSGGTPSYSYLWSNGFTTFNISNVGAGTFTVTVTDLNGCAKSKSVVIVSNPQLTLQVTPDAMDIASALATGGVPAYVYRWFTTPNQFTATASGLIPGNTYKVKVTDSKACTKTIYYTHHYPKLEFIQHDDFEVSITPNPTTGKFTLHIDSPECSYYKFTLHDITGRLVFEKEVMTNENKVEFDFTGYPHTIYSLSVSNCDKLRTLKLVIE